MLAGIWLLDGVLQYQSFMFSKAFGQMIAGTAAGNPAVIARPITWNATLVEHHGVLLNTIFATIQLLLGLGIAFRPTVRVALAASVAWSLGVWWFGEGLGGVLAAPRARSTARRARSSCTRCSRCCCGPPPGAGDCALRRCSGSGRAGRPGTVAGAVAELAWFAVTPANRAPQALHDMIAGMAERRAGLAGGLERNAAALVAGQGLAASIVLAAALALIAVGVYLPGRRRGRPWCSPWSWPR